jgi:hypothetical protein
MVKVLEPIMEKFFVREYLMESVAVRIPTNAMIPNEMMRMVRMVLRRWLRIEFREILKFSVIRVFFILRSGSDFLSKCQVAGVP